MGNIYVDDARTLVRFWEQCGDKTQKFAESICEISQDRNEFSSHAVWTIRMRPQLGRVPSGGIILLSHGTTFIQMLGNHDMYEPAFNSILPEVFGAFLAALGNKAGYSDFLGPVLAMVNRGKHMAEVWLKIEELFPQAAVAVTPGIVEFIVYPVSHRYWRKMKHLIPFSDGFPPQIICHEILGEYTYSVRYDAVTAITEGAFIWETQR